MSYSAQPAGYHGDVAEQVARGGRDGERAMVQGRGADKQRRMIDAAAVLLIDEGFDAITHRRVADAAGVPRGSASYYFPTRAGLVATAVRAAEDLRARSALGRADALPRRRRSAERTARELIETFFAPHVDDHVVTARLDPMLSALRDPALAPIMRESRPRLLDALRIVLEHSGYGHVDDVDLIAHLIDAALLTAAASGEDRLLDAAAATVGRFLAHY